MSGATKNRNRGGVGRPRGRSKRAFNTTLPPDVISMITSLKRTFASDPGVEIPANAVIELAIRDLDRRIRQRGEAE
jgi:hypothetical protein